MNSALLLIIGVGVYLLAYVFYGRYLSKLFGIKPKKPTPANQFKDGIDYVPTKAPVVFGHHFASIAGAGPIVGPVLGVCFGWVPVALWVILGCVFIGAVHDFSALFVSVRNKGRSIGHIIERYIGYTSRQLFLFFCFAALILVIAVFIPTFRECDRRSIVADIGGDLGILQLALDTYFRAYGKYPAEENYQKTLIEDPVSGEIIKDYLYDPMYEDGKKTYCYRTSPGRQYYIVYTCDGQRGVEAAIDNHGQIVFINYVPSSGNWISNGKLSQ